MQSELIQSDKMEKNNCLFILTQVSQPLLDWYHKNARVLPWRENTDPYRVWVSEIMLQQTRVAAVIPYFLRFMEQLPTVEALATAPEEQLLKLWEGLGYYSRARNLQKAAKIICAQYGGIFPERYEDILSLPGIGPYTAGAVASISFEQPIPAVDGNVLRVVSRLLELDTDLSGSAEKKQIEKLLSIIYPEGQCGAFTQALMELGAVICIPGAAPRCTACPLQQICSAFEAGTQATFPVTAQKKPRKKENKTVFLLHCKNKVALHRRPPHGLLGGLWEFPNAEEHLDIDTAEAWLTERGLSIQTFAEKAPKKHIFTHIEWHMRCYYAECDNENSDFIWVTEQTLLEEISLPTAFRKFMGEIGL